MNWITKFIKPKIKSLFKKQGSDAKETLLSTCECKKLRIKTSMACRNTKYNRIEWYVRQDKYKIRRLRNTLLKNISQKLPTEKDIIVLLGDLGTFQMREASYLYPNRTCIAVY